MRPFLLLTVVMLSGCGGVQTVLVSDPAPCPAQAAPLPPPFTEPSDPADLREYPAAHAENRVRWKSHAQSVEAWRAVRDEECFGDDAS